MDELTTRAAPGRVGSFALGRDLGERLVFGGITIIVKASTQSTNGAFTVFEETAPLGDVSRHVHANEDEMYYVVEGEHVFECGADEHVVGPGGVVFLPRGVPHAHRRVAPTVGRLLGMASPAGFEGFFRLLAEAERAGELGEAAYARASEDYDITWLE